MEKSDDIITSEELLKNVNKEFIIASKIGEKKNLKSCCYEKGYITQELFGCRTCYKEKAEMAGICVSCSFNCHEDHDLIHLCFKRNFRCDCGNSKFGNLLF